MQATRQRDLLRTRLDRSERQRAALRRRLETRRQRALASQPDAAVLEQVLPLRLAAVRASNHDGRAEREAAFAARSESYRREIREADANFQLPKPNSQTSIPESRIPARVTIAGLTWFMPAADATGGIAKRLAGGRLPLDEILETRELAVGRAMIDIGANIGTTSIPRALLGDFACVYAVEPDPANYACLVRNIAANGVRGLVLPDRVAIGDANGEMTLRTLTSGTHHLVTRSTDIDEHERVVVPCLTLDTWVERMGIDLSEVAFIKSDTQGWDARVLAGADGVLARKHIAWQMEFSPAMLERSGRSVGEVYALLERHFTHFIDLRGHAGARARRTSQLHSALAYVEDGRRRYTNVLLYTAAP